MSNDKNKYKPFGVNPWSGEYLKSLPQIDTIKDSPMFDYPDYDGENLELYKERVNIALLNDITYRALRNHLNTADVNFDYEEDRRRFEYGDINPVEGLRLLAEQPQVGSIELARYTHTGDWNGSDEIVEAVRRDILNDTDISNITKELTGEDSPPYYRVTGFSIDEPAALAITRKKEIFSHYGGKVISVLAESYVVDTTSSSIDSDIKEQIEKEFNRLRSLAKEKSSKLDEWNSLHHNFVGVAIDSLAKARRKSSLQDSLEGIENVNINGAIPLTSVIYATTREERRRYDQRSSGNLS